MTGPGKEAAAAETEWRFHGKEEGIEDTRVFFFVFQGWFSKQEPLC